MFDKNAYGRKYLLEHPEYREYKKSYLKRWQVEHPNYQKEWRKTHKGKCKEYAQNSNFREKMKVLGYYSKSIPPSCEHCKIDNPDVLCIDHINNIGIQKRKEVGLGNTFYQWLITHNFPEGYQVLCWNCNHLKELERLRNGNSI